MNENRPTDAALRRRAEERLKRQRPEGGEPRTEVETARLVHELQVHQIELEMQNEEFKTSRTKVEAGLALYSDLYDFAPTGYLTLDPEGAMKYSCQPRLEVTASPGLSSLASDSMTTPTAPPSSGFPNSKGGTYDFPSFMRPRMYGSTDMKRLRTSTCWS
jgi:hypothetical protein